MKSKILSLIALTLMAAHCSKQTEKTVTVTNEVKVPVEATHVEALVAADAGASLSIGNKIQLIVPAGALNQDTNISVHKAAVATPSENLVPLTNSVELGAHGVEFNKPVSLNVCYDPATLAAQNLKEETVAVYYVDPATGEYASVGGSVNKASHCITADLQHFSTYLVAAQILQGGNNAPVISAPTLLPTAPMAGLPLRLSTVITDFEQSTVNGQIGFGQIATAKLFYRVYQGDVNAAPYTEVALAPDYNDATGTRYTAKIPANTVTTAGLEYYIRAVDNLGLAKLRYPTKVANQPSIVINRTATGLSFQTNVVTDLAAGFKRSYTVKGNDNLGGSYNVEVESFAVNNSIGNAVQLSSAVVQFTATTAGAQNYRIGSLTVNSGAFTLTSQDIRVHAGMLDHIALLSPAGVVLGNSITVNANSTYDFDVLGYDAYGNTTNVLPLFVIVPVSGAGTISPTGLYTAPATAQTATLVATLDGVQDSILINVVVNSGWMVTGSLNGSRYCHTATRLTDGRVLLTGGYSDVTGALQNVSEIFDPNGNAGAGMFVITAPMISSRTCHTATLLPDGRVFITGGYNGIASNSNYSSEIFDPNGNGGAGVFTLTAPMSVPRQFHEATLLNDGRVLLTGSYDSTLGQISAEIFDPAGNGGLGSIVSTANMMMRRGAHTATKLSDGRVAIIGGVGSGVFISATEIFDSAGNAGTGSFTLTSNISSQRHFHTATLLADNRVLITGGTDNTQLSGSEFFDPAGNGGLGSFSVAASMSSARSLATAMLLADNRVLISGGSDQTGPLSSSEIFDPIGNGGLGSFSIAANMSSPRVYHRAVILADGRVLITGGYNGVNASDTAEIYQP